MKLAANDLNTAKNLTEQRRKKTENHEKLNPFLNESFESIEEEMMSSKEDYLNKNPFEIQSELDLLNPFVGERNSCIRKDIK